MRLIITDRNENKKIFTVCTALVRCPYAEHAANGLPNHTPFVCVWGGMIFFQAQNKQVLPHVVREW